MKKFALAALAAFSISSASAQAPATGDLIGDFGIGVGALSGGGSAASFTQRVAVEWGLAEFDMLNSDWSLTLGFQITNGAHSSSNTVRDPYTDFDITYRSVNDDLTFMPTGSIHHAFSDRFDAYATLGLGIGMLNLRVSEETPVAKKSLGDSAAAFAMAFNLGARYWFSSDWAVNAQFGLVSAAWKHDYGTYNILSVGVSHKF